MKTTIESGMLYEVTEDFIACPRKGRKVIVSAGEIIEFRYQHPIHFRTVDNMYLAVDEDTFLENTKPFAKVMENIRFRNKNTLKEILDARLYQEITNENND